MFNRSRDTNVIKRKWATSLICRDAKRGGRADEMRNVARFQTTTQNVQEREKGTKENIHSSSFARSLSLSLSRRYRLIDGLINAKFSDALWNRYGTVKFCNCATTFPTCRECHRASRPMKDARESLRVNFNPKLRTIIRPPLFRLTVSRVLASVRVLLLVIKGCLSS